MVLLLFDLTDETDELKSGLLTSHLYSRSMFSVSNARTRTATSRTGSDPATPVSSKNLSVSRQFSRKIESCEKPKANGIKTQDEVLGDVNGVVLSNQEVPYLAIFANIFGEEGVRRSIVYLELQECKLRRLHGNL